MSGRRRPEGELVTSRRGFFWVGGERVPVHEGTALRGQMFVQWEEPEEVTKPYPIVLIHGGGGQGTDWLGTPDGRPGWATFLVEQGYAVYVVDRPGHGRSPYHPDVLCPPGGVFTLEMISALFCDTRAMAGKRRRRTTRTCDRSPPEPGRCSRIAGWHTRWSRRAAPPSSTRSARRS